MKGALRRFATIAFVVAMATLVGLLVLLDRPRFYFCAAVIALLTACLVFVRSGRHWLYALGAVTCLATLTLALLPADPSGGGLCGSLLSPHDRETTQELAEEDGYDPASYLAACDDRRTTHVRLVAIGGLATLLVLGTAMAPVRAKRRDEDAAPPGNLTPSH